VSLRAQLPVDLGLADGDLVPGLVGPGIGDSGHHRGGAGSRVESGLLLGELAVASGDVAGRLFAVLGAGAVG
jgi:hypothetical protein